MPDKLTNFFISTANGPFVVSGIIHREEFGIDQRGKRKWVITHIRTGMMVGQIYTTLREARMVVDWLIDEHPELKWGSHHWKFGKYPSRKSRLGRLVMKIWQKAAADGPVE